MYKLFRDFFYRKVHKGFAKVAKNFFARSAASSWSLRLNLILFACTLLVCCNKPSSPDCFQSAGETTTERRTISEFDSLVIIDYIQVELFDSSEYFVDITAPENLIPEIITETGDDGALRIRNDNSCNWVRSFKNRITVRIYAPSFPHIIHRGTGEITGINTLSQEYLRIDNRHAAGLIDLDLDVDSVGIFTHTGVVDVMVRGTCIKAEFFEQGFGWIDARDLQSQQVYVNNSSINDVFVNATDYLFGVVYFSGNIYYRGNPPLIDEDILGSGEIVPLE